MLFNGHTAETIDLIDEATFSQISIMYADGIIGNAGIIQNLGSLVAGVFNYMRDPKQTAYSIKSILGSQYDYIFKEPEVSPSDSLLGFVSQGKGFSLDKFKRG